MNQETFETPTETFMERVWNQLDTTVIDELIADEHVSYGVGDPIEGKSGWHGFHATFTAAFSDIQVTVEDLVISGDKEASRWTGTMVHRASGTPVTLSGMIINHICNGKIVAGYNSVDFLPMLMTLNIMPGDAVEKALTPA